MTDLDLTIFAGSAIEQGAGKLSNIDEWCPTTKERRWLLIAGSSHSPDAVTLSEKGEREASSVAQGERRSQFLKGVSNDFVNMERAVGHTLKNKIQNLEMEKREVEKHIKKFFAFCKTNKFKPMLYYSGHGELPTGNWCFSDGVVGIEEILEWMPAGMTPPTIVSDACFSGTWSHFCTQKQIEGFDCLSATYMHQAAYDQGDKGGELTLYITGQGDLLPDGRRTTYPLYSRGTDVDFTDQWKYNKVTYIDLVKYHTFNDNNILLYQCVDDNYMIAVYGSYAKHKNKMKAFWCSANYEEFTKEMKTHKKSGKFIFSIAADQSTGKLYTYTMEGYGNFQTILTSDSPKDLESEDLSITDCFALSSKYYFVLTAGVEEFEGKTQKVLTAKTRADLETEIQKYKPKGMIITSFCHNVEKEEYLIVMTESDLPQEHKWFAEDGEEWDNWSREMYYKSYYYKIRFLDPFDGHQLCVKVKDSNLTDSLSYPALLYS